MTERPAGSRSGWNTDAAGAPDPNRQRLGQDHADRSELVLTASAERGAAVSAPIRPPAVTHPRHRLEGPNPAAQALPPSVALGGNPSRRSWRHRPRIVRVHLGSRAQDATAGVAEVTSLPVQNAGDGSQRWRTLGLRWDEHPSLERGKPASNDVRRYPIRG